MLTQLPSVPSLIPSSFATRAIGRDVSITIFTASSLNSGEKLFFGRGNYFTFPDGPSYWMDCPEGSGHLTRRGAVHRVVLERCAGRRLAHRGGGAGPRRRRQGRGRACPGHRRGCQPQPTEVR